MSTIFPTNVLTKLLWSPDLKLNPFIFENTNTHLSVISSVLAFRPSVTQNIFYHEINWNTFSTMKTSKVTRNLVLQRFPRCIIFWTKPFSRGGCCQKWQFFQNFHPGRKIFPSLTKYRACLEIPNIWQESQFIWLTFTIESTRQNLVVKI